jgi:hypothetical protein
MSLSKELAMPRYSVRRYSTYRDEFEVEATSAEEAIRLAEAYDYAVEVTHFPGGLDAFAGKVTQLAKHEYVDHDNTCVNELDADGNWIE